MTIKSDKILNLIIKLLVKVMASINIVGADTIRKHPTNNSTSKNAYVFSKTKRFPDPNPECKHAFYTCDSQLSDRKTSIGYGRKYQLSDSMPIGPPATAYKHQSLFDENQSKGKGKSFGLSRDSIPDKSYLIPQLQKIPGPGHYENQKETRMRIGYSMRAKTADIPQQKQTFRKSPGPGAYKEVDMEPKAGRFTVSKFGDTKFAKIFAEPPRFKQPKESPGPSSYREKDGVSQKGKYVLSQRVGRGTRPFDQSARETFAATAIKRKSTIPGPGAYQLPSEFGFYGDAKQYKNSKVTIG